MMQYDMSPGDIHRIAEDLFASGRISDALLAGKLEDIEYLYDRMMAYLKDKYIVPEELLDRAIRVMDKAAFLDDCEIYLDRYTGFTPVQLRFLGCLMRKCKRLVVTVTLGREHLVEGGFLFNTNTAGRSPQTELFSLGINTVRQLVRLALEEPAVPVEDPMTLVSQKRFPHVPEFVFLSERLFRPRSYAAGPTAATKKSSSPMPEGSVPSTARSPQLLQATRVRQNRSGEFSTRQSARSSSPKT